MLTQVFRNNILRAYGTSLLGVFSGLLTNLWLLREFTQVIPAQDFGTCAFVLQIAGYLAILQVGLDFAASRQIAESLGRNDIHEARSAFVQLRRFNNKVVLLAIVVVLALSSLLWSGLVFPQSINAGSSRLAAIVAFVAGTAQVITFLTRPYSAALIGSQFQATVNIITAVRTIATTLLAYGLLKAGFYVLSAIAAEVVMQALNLGLLRVVARRKCSWQTAPPASNRSVKVLGSMLKYGGLTSLGGLAWTIESGMDVLLLGFFTSPSIVTAYVLWWRFPQMIFDLCTRLAYSAFPGFSHSFGESQASAQRLFSKVAYFTLGLATLALVGLSFWLRPFMQLWIGVEYLGAQSIHLAALMGLLVCLRTCGNLLSIFWLASGNAKFTTVLAWSQAGLKLALAAWFVPNWGILGVVIASCGASFLQLVAMAGLLLHERLLTPAFGGRALVLFSMAALIALMTGQQTISVGWVGFIAGTAATALCWSALCLALACTGEFRNQIFALLRAFACQIKLLKTM